MPKMKNLKVLSLIEFDTFVATHGPGTYVEELAGSKRKLSALSEEPSKQQKFLYLAYFNPELAHVVAMSDEKLPFVALGSSRWSAGGMERHFPFFPLIPLGVKFELTVAIIRWANCRIVSCFSVNSQVRLPSASSSDTARKRRTVRAAPGHGFQYRCGHVGTFGAEYGPLAAPLHHK
ncbi:hypothetical protein quinque_014499 [Culex quinquefasciatus]